MIKEIREKIIEAVPKIVELKFGCEFYWKARTDRFIGHYTIVAMENVGSDFETYMAVHKEKKQDIEDIGKFDQRIKTEKEFEIIGRPIRLADVLLAIQVGMPSFSQKVVMDAEQPRKIVGMWKLADDNLEHQSEATLEFLHNLLKD